jgi:hypothetical protein
VLLRSYQAPKDLTELQALYLQISAALGKVPDAAGCVADFGWTPHLASSHRAVSTKFKAAKRAMERALRESVPAPQDPAAGGPAVGGQPTSSQNITAAGNALRATLVVAIMEQGKLPEGIFSADADGLFNWTAFHSFELPSPGQIFALTNLLHDDTEAQCLREILRRQPPENRDGTPQHEAKSAEVYRAIAAYMGQKTPLAENIDELQRQRVKRQLQGQMDLVSWEKMFDAPAVWRFANRLAQDLSALQPGAAQSQVLAAGSGAPPPEAFCRHAITWVLRSLTHHPMSAHVGAELTTQLNSIVVEPGEMAAFSRNSGLPRPVKMAQNLAASLQTPPLPDSNLAQRQLLTVLRALSRMTDRLTATIEPSGPAPYATPEDLGHLLAVLEAAAQSEQFEKVPDGPGTLAEARSLLTELAGAIQIVAKTLPKMPTLHSRVQAMRSHAGNLRDLEENIHTLAPCFGIQEIRCINARVISAEHLSVTSMEALQRALEVPKEITHYDIANLTLPQHNNYPAILEWTRQGLRDLQAYNEVRQYAGSGAATAAFAPEGGQPPVPATLAKLQEHLKDAEQLSHILLKAPLKPLRVNQPASPKVQALQSALLQCVTLHRLLPLALRRTIQLRSYSLARCRNLRVDELFALCVAMPKVPLASRFLSLYTAAPLAQRQSMLACNTGHTLASVYNQLRTSPEVRQQTHLRRQEQQTDQRKTDKKYDAWHAQPKLGGTVDHLRECISILAGLNLLRRGYTQPLCCEAELARSCQHTAVALASIATDLGAPTGEFVQILARPWATTLEEPVSINESLIRFSLAVEQWKDDVKHCECQATSRSVCDGLARLLVHAQGIALRMDQLSVERLPLPYASPATLVEQFRPVVAQMHDVEGSHGATAQNTADCLAHLSSIERICSDAAEPWQKMETILGVKEIVLDVHNLIEELKRRTSEARLIAPAARVAPVAAPRQTPRDRQRARPASASAASALPRPQPPPARSSEARPLSPRLTLAADSLHEEVDEYENLCAITLEPIAHLAVTNCPKGHRFERAAIEGWLRKAEAGKTGKPDQTLHCPECAVALPAGAPLRTQADAAQTTAQDAAPGAAPEPVTAFIAQPAYAANGQRHRREGRLLRGHQAQQEKERFRRAQDILFGVAATD